MELLQWVVPLESGEIATAWAPVWADRIPSLGRWRRPVRRRGAPLVSRWLSAPLVVGTLDVEGNTSPDDNRDSSLRRTLRAGSITVRLGVALDGEARTPVLPPGADDVRFAGLFTELVHMLADLSEAAGIPVVGIAADDERRGMELRLGALGPMNAVQLADALVLLRVAAEMGMQTRGLQLVDARVLVEDTPATIDGRVVHFLADAAPPP